MKEFTAYTIRKEYEGLTLECYLKQILHCSGRKIQKLTRQKGLRLNGKAVFLQKKVRSGDVLQVLKTNDVSYGVQPEPGRVEILYEDDHMLVVNKPPAQLVHPAGQTSGGTLANYLAYDLQQRGILTAIRPLHRLDRDTSGCVVFAKDDRSQFLLEQQLQDGGLKRTYHALVKGNVSPADGIIDEPIGRHPARPNRRAVRRDGDRALTHYRTINRYKDACLLELELETGRTHQIRLHLAYRGWPIIGDGMYGIRMPWMRRQALHAVSLRFRHLTEGREIMVLAPLPADFTGAVAFCETDR